jgi:integrase
MNGPRPIGWPGTMLVDQLIVYRLKKGGAASHLALVSRDDIATRYGLFLGFLKLTGRLEMNAAAAAQVAPANVEAYMTDLVNRKVSSVTAWNCIYKLRRAAQLLSPKADFDWLAEIEKDVALVMEPKSKFDRLVLTEQLVEAGLTLVMEAKTCTTARFIRARGIRNGLTTALLALCPIRRKNFAALEIGKTFRQVKGRWWITLSGRDTKMGSPEERPIPEWMNEYIDLYLNEARPVLLKSSRLPTDALWISSNTGDPMKAEDVGVLINQTTEQTIGVRISPHLFRTADATVAAEAVPDMPHLASALLGHKHPSVTEEHYNRASSLSAGNRYAALIRQRFCGDGADNLKSAPTPLCYSKGG